MSCFNRIGRLLTIGLSSALLAATASAATEFRVLSWAGDLSGFYYLGSSGVMQEIDAGKRSFSSPYVYTGEPPLRFFKKTTDAETGEDVFEVVGELSPVPDYSMIGLLLFEKSSGQYQVYPLDISAKFLPGGSYCFVNMTDRKLAFQVGESVFYLSSGENHKLDGISNLGNSDATGGRSIVVRAAEEQSGDWTQVLNVRWMISELSRTFVFVYDRNGKIAMRRFADTAQ